jgi:hypothetical protein
MGCQKLSDEVIMYLQFDWLKDKTSYLDAALRCDNLLPYFQRLKEYDVLEIGPGDNPLCKHFECKSYESAEGYYPYDGLSMLRKQDHSVVVVSFGVIDSDILQTECESRKKNLFEQYAVEMADEIRMVSSPFAMIFGNSAEKYFGAPDVVAVDNFQIYGGIYLGIDAKCSPLTPNR